MNRNTAAPQSASLPVGLKHGPVDTVHAFRSLDILHDLGLVFDVRKAGSAITTSWVARVTEHGVSKPGQHLLAGEEAEDRMIALHAQPEPFGALGFFWLRSSPSPERKPAMLVRRGELHELLLMLIDAAQRRSEHAERCRHL
jgi:hypothetical protein